MNQPPRLTRVIGGVALAAALGGTSAAGGQPLPVERVLPARLAAEAATAAVAACAQDGYRVAAAVADRAGVARVVVRGDGAGPHTVDSSTRKAYTAATFRQPTTFLMELSGSTPAAATLRHIDRVLLLGGGLPIAVGDDVIGAIGVAGAPGVVLDDACAQAGLDAIKGRLAP